jgi:hypothetical protein
MGTCLSLLLAPLPNPLFIVKHGSQGAERGALPAPAAFAALVRLLARTLSLLLTNGGLQALLLSHALLLLLPVWVCTALAACVVVVSERSIKHERDSVERRRAGWLVDG